LDVFRVCFQLIFAMVPVGVFLIACRLVEPGYAVLCGGLFIAFPTFVNDMSMTNRQEIAFVFFTVALLALVGVRTARWRRTTLFTVAAVGLTVSHYSSTYVTAALLVLAWILRRLRLRLGPGWALRPRSPVGATSRTVLALGTATATVTVMAVTWAVFTGSALELSGNLHRAVAAVATHASVLSGGTAYSPVASETAIDDTARLREYANVLRHDRAGQEAAPAPPGCTARVAPPDLLPLTALGTAMANDGVAPGPFNAAVRGILVVLYEVGAAAGTVMLWWRARTAREEPRPADRVMVELSGAAMGLL